jgi:DNA-binding CsgD family transcriptional regulator/PAS domain-containing protein
MGADHPIVLEPRCPSEGDPGIQEFLRLAKALTGASWVELELQPNGEAPASKYLIGDCTGRAVTVGLDVGVEFTASLRLGMAAQPKNALVTMLSNFVSRVLELRNMHIQITLLSGVLDSASHAVLIFDGDGHILFANPPADHLLSLQTEDELPASFNGQPRQPLFTLLCALVERVTSDVRGVPPWRGTIEFGDGRMMVCQVTRVENPSFVGPDPVLVTLQPSEPESDARIQAFASSHGLSPREEEVLHLLGRGLTTAAMAEELGISPHTVRDHLKHLYSKTGTKGRSELLGMISRSAALSVDA